MNINEAASSDEATFATKPDARVDDPEAVTIFHCDDPYWQGFIKGVEEVWSTRKPSVFGPEDAI